MYSLGKIMVAIMPLSEGAPFRDPATGNLALHWAILVFGLVVVVYTLVGGLWAVLMTDVLQFIVLTLAVLFVAPLILVSAGGIGDFIQRAPEGFLRPTSGEYGGLFLTGWVAIHFFMVGAEWAFVQRYLCVADKKAARKGTYLFGILYLVSPFLWFLPPMAFRIISPGLDKEQAYILACQSVLPLGMVGLMAAAMFSATASMVSSQLNVFAGVLTQDIYRRLIRRTAADRELVLVGRLATGLLGAALVVIAVLVPKLGGAEQVIIAITSLIVTPLLAPAVWGLFRRNIGPRQLVATLAVCFSLGLVAKFGLTEHGFLASVGALRPLAEWVQAHPKSTDVLIGVVLPLFVLVLLDWASARREHAGWRRLAAHRPDPIDTAGTMPGRMPGFIVAAGIAACGALMLAMIPFNETGRGILALYAALMLLAGGGVTCLTARRAKRNDTSS